MVCSLPCYVYSSMHAPLYNHRRQSNTPILLSASSAPCTLSHRCTAFPSLPLQASAVGKVVVSAPQLAPVDLRAAALSNLGTGRIIITGGMGALGLLVAAWLAGRQGIHYIMLVSRSGRPASDMSEASSRLLASLMSGSATVDVVAADVAAAEDSLLVGLGAAGLPVVGLVHASGVLEDAALRKQKLQGLSR